MNEILIADYEMNGRKSIRRARICMMRLGEFFRGSLALDITTDRIQRYITRRFEDGMAPAMSETRSTRLGERSIWPSRRGR